MTTQQQQPEPARRTGPTFILPSDRRDQKVAFGKHLEHAAEQERIAERALQDARLRKAEVLADYNRVARNPTTQEALQAAFRALRKAGWTAKAGIRSCCRSCVGPADLGWDEKSPLLWTGAIQGSWAWLDGEPAYRDGKRLTTAVGYINHDATPEQVAEAVRVLRAHGVRASWDGQPHTCIEVRPAWLPCETCRGEGRVWVKDTTTRVPCTAQGCNEGTVEQPPVEA